MLTRIIEERVVFNSPFQLPGSKKLLSSGSYRIKINQEVIEGLSFLAYRKTSVILFVPIDNTDPASGERSIIFEPQDFNAFLQKDKTRHSRLFYEIKESRSGSSWHENDISSELRTEIERAENEGMPILE